MVVHHTELTYLEFHLEVMKIPCDATHQHTIIKTNFVFRLKSMLVNSVLGRVPLVAGMSPFFGWLDAWSGWT